MERSDGILFLVKRRREVESMIDLLEIVDDLLEIVHDLLEIAHDSILEKCSLLFCIRVLQNDLNFQLQIPSSYHYYPVLQPMRALERGILQTRKQATVMNSIEENASS